MTMNVVDLQSLNIPSKMDCERDIESYRDKKFIYSKHG